MYTPKSAHFSHVLAAVVIVVCATTAQALGAGNWAQINAGTFQMGANKGGDPLATTATNSANFFTVTSCRLISNAASDTFRAGPSSEEFDRAVEIDDAHAEGHFLRAQALDRLERYPEARQAYLAAKDRDELRFRAPEAYNKIIREVAHQQLAQVVEVQEAFVREARDGIVGTDLMLEHLHPNLRGYFVLADAFHEALRAEEMFGPWDKWITRDLAWEEIPVTEVDRLYGEYRIRHLTSDWPFSKRRERFRIGPAARRVERIAQKYYRGSYKWPDAMKKLVDLYRTTHDVKEAAKVAVLLAEAFPYEAKRKLVAAELLDQAGRWEGSVYAERALEIVGPQEKARLIELQEVVSSQ